MGDAGVTTQNLEVVTVDRAKNLIIVRGAVPGAPGGLVVVKKSVKKQKVKQVQTAPAKKRSQVAMASAKVLTMDGRELDPIELDDAIYGVDFNHTMVHDVVVALMNATRQGNAETKTRKEVRGGGKKPYRQKGTGNARHGSSREPEMKGGGTVFGPHKRSYRQNVPLRSRRQALCCALSERVRSQKFVRAGFTESRRPHKPNNLMPY